MDAIRASALVAIEPKVRAGCKSFKVESRRADKGFPLDSYAISREIGACVLAAHPELRVDVHAPETVLNVEIREHAYIYTDGEKGVRGLPVGSAGKGLLLLSGGIDSPVAGYLMAARGLALEALHFTSYPYTSKEAWQKVRDLAGVLSRYTGSIVLHTVPFTEVQLAIKAGAPAECATLYLRAAMMSAAQLLADERRLSCVVSGESLSQVASQTAENIRFTQSYTDYPVMRPLIGTDKEDTIDIARAIGSYDISILPYEDCCVLFSAKHPVLKADFVKERRAFDMLGIQPKIAEAVAAKDSIDIQFRLREP
jgi:thiamine biosynthesis protein ThiI